MMLYNEGNNFRQINLEKSNLDKEGRKLLLSKMGTIMDTISQLLNLWLKLCQTEITGKAIHPLNNKSTKRAITTKTTKNKRQYDDKYTSKYN